MGLHKANRLTERQHFKQVYQYGIRLSTPHLILRALTEQKEPSLPPRLGISISQKVSKKAVVRNRIKRQLHGAFRQLLPLLSPGWKLVVVVKTTAVECKYEHFLRELKQLLVKAKIINGY